jgi:hypothetical protein
VFCHIDAYKLLVKQKLSHQYLSPIGMSQSGDFSFLNFENTFKTSIKPEVQRCIKRFSAASHLRHGTRICSSSAEHFFVRCHHLLAIESAHYAVSHVMCPYKLPHMSNTSNTSNTRQSKRKRRPDSHDDAVLLVTRF